MTVNQEAFEIAKQINTPYVQVNALHNLADAYAAKGMLPEALNHAQMALDISNKQKLYPLVRAETLNTFGEIYLKQKKPKDALSPFEEALTLSNNARITSSKLRSLRGIGTSYLELGQKQDALTYLRQAQEIYRNAGIDSPDSRKVQDLIDQLAGEKPIRDRE